MQYDPSNQGYNKDGNQYLPMNQVPQSVTGNAYPYVISFTSNCAIVERLLFN
jgi:hypothetical protein